MAAKWMCYFPPLPNQMLKIWFTAFINGITPRPAQSIYSNWGILVNLILSLVLPPSPRQIFLWDRLISARGSMANCSPRAQAYAQARARWEWGALKAVLFIPVISCVTEGGLLRLCDCLAIRTTHSRYISWRFYEFSFSENTQETGECLCERRDDVNTILWALSHESFFESLGSAWRSGLQQSSWHGVASL